MEEIEYDIPSYKTFRLLETMYRLGIFKTKRLDVLFGTVIFSMEN